MSTIGTSRTHLILIARAEALVAHAAREAGVADAACPVEVEAGDEKVSGTPLATSLLSPFALGARVKTRALLTQTPGVDDLPAQ